MTDITTRATDTLGRAIESVQDSADTILRCHTIAGEWEDDDVADAAKVIYDREIALVADLAALKEAFVRGELYTLAQMQAYGRDLVAAALAARSSSPVNQCDGCNVGAPLTERGNHAMPDGGHMSCTKDRYSPVEAGASSGDAVIPDFKTLLTPYGMLVRALRIVAKTTLYDMSQALLTTPAKLSSMEFGRAPVTQDFVFDVSAYFDALGVPNTQAALQAALATASDSAEGGQS